MLYAEIFLETLKPAHDNACEGKNLECFFADTWIMYPLFFSRFQINIGGIYGIYNSIRRC